MPPNGFNLVVDNDPPTLELIAEELSDEGYTVRAVLTPAAARAAIREQHSDLVLVDLHLSEIAGDAQACELRSTGLVDAIIILMTDDVRKTKELALDGIDFCLLKPFDLEELLDCVAQQLRLWQAHS